MSGTAVGGGFWPKPAAAQKIRLRTENPRRSWLVRMKPPGRNHSELRRLTQGGVRRQTEARLNCDKDDLTWAARNGVYRGRNIINNQRTEAKQTSYQLTVRKFRRSAARKLFLTARSTRLLNTVTDHLQS